MTVKLSTGTTNIRTIDNMEVVTVSSTDNININCSLHAYLPIKFNIDFTVSSFTCLNVKLPSLREDNFYNIAFNLKSSLDSLYMSKSEVA